MSRSIGMLAAHCVKPPSPLQKCANRNKNHPNVERCMTREVHDALMRPEDAKSLPAKDENHTNQKHARERARAIAQPAEHIVGRRLMSLTFVRAVVDDIVMTPATERTIKMLGHAWIAGACVSAFLGWLLVPSALSVGHLTPIVVAGPFVGLVAGGILVRTLRSA